MNKVIQDGSSELFIEYFMDIETEKRKVQAIPVEAVKQDGENYYVFVVEKGQLGIAIGSKAKKLDKLPSLF